MLFNNFKTGNSSALLAAVMATLGTVALSDVQMALAQRAGAHHLRKRVNSHRTRANRPSKGPRLARATGPGSYAQCSPNQALRLERAARALRGMDFSEMERRVAAARPDLVIIDDPMLTKAERIARHYGMGEQRAAEAFAQGKLL